MPSGKIQKVFPGVPSQWHHHLWRKNWIQLLAHLLSFLVSLSFLCHDLSPNSERLVSASKAQIAESKGWSGGFGKTPFHYFAWSQDVLINIVPQLGISAVFGQIQLSITPHMHEFSRAHLGWNVFKNWWLRLQIWFPPSIPCFKGFDPTAQSVWHNPDLGSLAGTWSNPLAFSNRAVVFFSSARRTTSCSFSSTCQPTASAQFHGRLRSYIVDLQIPWVYDVYDLFFTFFTMVIKHHHVDFPLSHVCQFCPHLCWLSLRQRQDSLRFCPNMFDNRMPKNLIVEKMMSSNKIAMKMQGSFPFLDKPLLGASVCESPQQTFNFSTNSEASFGPRRAKHFRFCLELPAKNRKWWMIASSR